MFISKRKYEELEKYKKLYDTESHKNTALRKIQENNSKEIKKLTDEISAQTGTCKVGPWCNGCKHKRTAYVSFLSKKLPSYSEYFAQCSSYNMILYCGKHLDELCPEREAVEKKG